MQVPEGLEEIGPYYIGDELAAAGLFITVEKQLLDLSAGWAFVMTVNAISGTTIGAQAFTKNTGMTGAVGAGTKDDPAGIPNLVVVWSNTAGQDLNAIATPGRYLAQVVGTKSSDAFTRWFILEMRARI